MSSIPPNWEDYETEEEGQSKKYMCYQNENDKANLDRWSGLKTRGPSVEVGTTGDTSAGLSGSVIEFILGETVAPSQAQKGLVQHTHRVDS